MMLNAWDIALQEHEHQLKIHNNNPLGFVTESPDDFHALDVGGGYFKLLPGPEFNTWLYRGQAEFYNPCYPTLYRGGNRKLELFVERLRVVQFYHALKQHPAIIHSLKHINIMGNSLWIDYEGLAQHYGLKTELLDFSSDPWVAAFFSVTSFDKEADRFIPIKNVSNPGIFYRLNLLFGSGDHGNTVADIVGLQPLRRPGEQKAFSLRLKKGECINRMKSVQCQRFQHSDYVSEKVMELFSRGDDLLPKDPVAKKAVEVASLKVFSINAFNECRERYWPLIDKVALKKRLKRLGVFLTTDNPSQFTHSELHEMRVEWESRRSVFSEKVKYRPVLVPLNK